MSVVFGDQTNVTLTFEHKDANGVDVTVTAGSYRVLDETGAETVATTGLTPTGTSTDVTVAAVGNTLAAGTPRGARTVEVTFTTDAGNSVVVTSTYLLEKATILEIMTNSYQTFGSAELNASAIPELEVWTTKTERERKMGLIQAFHRLGGLTYRVSEDLTIPYLNALTVRRLNDWTADEFDGLADRFKNALERAQVVEADVILGGDQITNLRRDGLLSTSIGEVSQFFRPSKPLRMAVSDRALRQLQGFVSFAVGITRT